MRYARLYDGTVANDYFQAMEKVEAYSQLLQHSELHNVIAKPIDSS